MTLDEIPRKIGEEKPGELDVRDTWGREESQKESVINIKICWRDKLNEHLNQLNGLVD